MDRALFNSLRQRFDLGLFDPQAAYDWPSTDQVGSATSWALTLRASEEALVLLRNDAALLPLPLPRTGKKKTSQNQSKSDSSSSNISSNNNNHNNNNQQDQQQQQQLKLALVGPHAHAQEVLVQPYAFTPACAGHEGNYYGCLQTPAQAIAALNDGGGGVINATTVEDGCDLFFPDESNFSKAVDAARQADVVVLMLGIETCGMNPVRRRTR